MASHPRLRIDSMLSSDRGEGILSAPVNEPPQQWPGLQDVHRDSISGSSASSASNPFLRPPVDAPPTPISSPPRAKAGEQASASGQPHSEHDEDVEMRSPGSGDSRRRTWRFCLCPPEPKIPRPRNAFILYRQHKQSQIAKENPRLSNPEISKIVGEYWREESDEVKQTWKVLAEEEKHRHQQQYPDYRYQPRKASRKGSEETGEAPTSEVDICPKCGGRSMAPTPGAQMMSTHGSVVGSMKVAPPQHPHHGRQYPQTPVSTESLNARFQGQANVSSPHLGFGPRRELHGLPEEPGMSSSPRSAVPRVRPGHEVHEHDRVGLTRSNSKRRKIAYNINTSVPASRPGGPDTPLPFGHGHRASISGPLTGISFSQHRGPLPRPESLSLQQGPLSASPATGGRPGVHSATMPPPGFHHGPPPQSRPIHGMPPASMPTQFVRANLGVSVGERTYDSSVILPPLQPRTPKGASFAAFDTPSPMAATREKLSAKEVIRVMNPLRKIRILNQIAPPLSIPKGTPHPQGRNWGRGVLLAVEGDEGKDVSQVTAWLSQFLSKEGDFAVKSFDPPEKPSTQEASYGDYLQTVTSWHQKSKEIAAYLGADSSPSAKDSTTEPVAIDVDIDQPTQASPSSQPHPNLVLTENDITPTLANPNPGPSTQSPQSQPIPIALLSTYHLTTTTSYALSLPTHDAYSPPDHWQWCATLWRGTPGPDITIYIKEYTSDDQAAAGQSNNNGNGNGNGGGNGKGHGNGQGQGGSGLGILKGSGKPESLVQVVKEVRTVAVWREKGKEVEERELRRVGFEVGEWVRVVAGRGGEE